MKRLNKIFKIIFRLHEKGNRLSTEELNIALKDAACYFIIKNTLEIVGCIFLLIKIGYDISHGVTLTPGFFGSLTLAITAIIFFVLTLKIIATIYSGKSAYERYKQFNEIYLLASRGVPYYFYIPACLSGIFYFTTVLPEKGVNQGIIIAFALFSVVVVGVFVLMNRSLVINIKKELEFLKCPSRS